MSMKSKRSILPMFSIVFLMLIPSALGICYTESTSPVITNEPRPDIEWFEDYGGEEYLDNAVRVRATTDGGYIFAGETKTYGADPSFDMWLVKIDQYGIIQWHQTYGKMGHIEDGRCVQQTLDGGYIISGYTDGHGDISGDAWVVKTNAVGDMEWNHTYGGPLTDHGNFIVQTSDGDYLLSGWREPYNHPYGGAFAVRIAPDGTERWNRSYGESEDWGAMFFCGQETVDNGFILTGRIYDYVTDNWVLYLVRINETGKELWNRTFEPENNSVGARGIYVRQTPDNGYLIAGHCKREDENTRALLLKTDAEGYEEWHIEYTGPSYDSYMAEEVDLTPDGGYILGGPAYDASSWVAKTDQHGNVQWDYFFDYKVYGEILFRSVINAHDGGYLIAGCQNPTGISGRVNAILIKLGNTFLTEITKPDNALFLFNNRILNFPVPLIFGPIEVIVDTEEPAYLINEVRFYIDETLVLADTEQPFEYQWNTPAFFKHHLKVIAINSEGDSGRAEQTVWKFF